MAATPKFNLEAPDGSTVTTSGTKPYTHGILVPSDKKEGATFARHSMHTSKALATKELARLRENGHMDAVLVPAVKAEAAPKAAAKPAAAKPKADKKPTFASEAATEAAMRKNEKAYLAYQATGRGKDNPNRAGYSAYKVAYQANLEYRKARGAGRRTKAEAGKK